MAELRLQCFWCSRWYTAEEVSIKTEDYISFMSSYEYTCKKCGQEAISKKAASFIQIAITAIANLTASTQVEGQNRIHFDVDEEIIPFIEKHWDQICTLRTRSAVWKQNLKVKLTNEKRIFSEDATSSFKFGLVDQDLSKIGPKRYESKPLSSKATGKRKAGEGASEALQAKKGKMDTSMTHGYPSDHPFNKDGFSYVFAEQDPHASLDIDPEDLAGKPIPPELYRPVVGDTVLLSANDRASQLKVSEDRLSVSGEKGYSLVRATSGISEGKWYFEATLKNLPNPTSAARMGWSQPYGHLQAPCGFDKYSYSWRSLKGTKFHQSKGRHYTSGGYTVGDVIGFYIELPPLHSKKTILPITHKNEALIKFKNFFYFEHRNVPEGELQIHPGSKIVCYKNGVSQGIAFSDIYKGTYFPSISLFKGAEVSVNFGPHFQYKPMEEYKPISDSGIMNAVRHTVAEMLFHVEARIQKDTSMDTAEQ